MDNSVIAALAAALAAEDEAGGLPATREFGRGAALGRSVAAAARERPWYPDSVSSEDSLSFDNLTLRSPSVPTKYFIGKRGRTLTCTYSTSCYLQYADLLRIRIGIQGWSWLIYGCCQCFGSGFSILGWIPIRIRSGSRVLMTKSWKNLQLKTKFNILLYQNCCWLFSQNPQKRTFKLQEKP